MLLVQPTRNKIGRKIKIYAEIIFLHTCNRPEKPLMSILKLFVDTFVISLKREVIIITLLNENIVFLHLEMIVQRRKKEKSESVKVV